MIRHIVLFSAIDSQDVQIIRDGLRNLIAIPSAKLLEVEFNSRKDQWSNEVDVVVYGEFENEEALSEFKSHPIYKDTIKDIKPLRELRIAVDYEIP
ncbi:MAG: stress responsive protein [Rhodospirillaceae bacterium]|nr:stress responsive protein [Rhodospirillaceae bacterium]|tara:strand:- start:1751 stop:2038 length:288 start_codon:yes stop_codon:yes gene_type:complete